ncbi:MAG: mycothiol conjugate amidase Mca [Microthrixaceae bacterium]|nr:mycothiol conjugate amidase Mca [Microthrixaceae bacterium]
MSNEPLRLLTVHAHPDDESSKGPGTIAKYLDQGIPATLVCCTGGEAGDILNPAMDRPEVRENLHEVRMQELAQATSIIGYDRVELLGYRDSGMPDDEANKRPDNFWNAPIDEATGKLVEIIRRDRPQVIVTYGDDQRYYAHPDHLRVHDISAPAFERAGDPTWYPELGDPWQPMKLYYIEWSLARVQAMHKKFIELGLESPFEERWAARMAEAGIVDRTTTRIERSEYYDVGQKALLSHATQIDPNERFWFGLPDDVARSVHPYDDYMLAKSVVGVAFPEDDLFAGIPGR